MGRGSHMSLLYHIHWFGSFQEFENNYQRISGMGRGSHMSLLYHIHWFGSFQEFGNNYRSISGRGRGSHMSRHCCYTVLSEEEQCEASQDP